MATRCSPETSSDAAAAPLLAPSGGTRFITDGRAVTGSLLARSFLVPPPGGGGGWFAASSTGRSSAEASSTTGRSKLAASLSSTTRGAWSSSAARDSPGGSGANSGFPESDHLGATTSGDRSSPAPGGGADQMASPGTALEGALRTGLVGGGGADQSATGSGAAGADQISSASGAAGWGVVGQSWGVACGATAQGESPFAGGAIGQFGSTGGAAGSDQGVSIGRSG